MKMNRHQNRILDPAEVHRRQSLKVWQIFDLGDYKENYKQHIDPATVYEHYGPYSIPQGAIAEMKTIIFTAVLVAIFPSLCHCQKDELSVKVTLKGKEVSAANAPFAVQASVINTSGKEQSIIIMSCSYADYWKIDSSSLYINPSICTENGPSCKTLKPGEELEWPIYLWLKDQNIRGNLIFKLGYDGCHCQEPIWIDGKIIVNCVKRQTYWSNPVTVTVK
jgi:hypothetical protein